RFRRDSFNSPLSRVASRTNWARRSRTGSSSGILRISGKRSRVGISEISAKEIINPLPPQYHDTIPANVPEFWAISALSIFPLHVAVPGLQGEGETKVREVLVQFRDVVSDGLVLDLLSRADVMLDVVEVDAALGGFEHQAEQVKQSRLNVDLAVPADGARRD